MSHLWREISIACDERITQSATTFKFYISPLKYQCFRTIFWNLSIQNVHRSKGFTLCFDKTINSKNKKELQLQVKYFLETRHKVVHENLQTRFLRSATETILSDNIVCAVEDLNLSLQKLIMVGWDSPNVNKKVFTILNAKLIDAREKGLLNVDTCNLYVVHNAFIKDLHAFGSEVVDFMTDVYNFFHQWLAWCKQILMI